MPGVTPNPESEANLFLLTSNCRQFHSGEGGGGGLEAMAAPVTDRRDRWADLLIH